MYQLKTIKCPRKYEVGFISESQKRTQHRVSTRAQLWMSCAPAFAANLCRAYSGARRCREQQMHLAVTPVDMPSAAPFLVLHRRFSQVSTKRQISTLPADSTKAHHLGYCPTTLETCTMKWIQIFLLSLFFFIEI